MVKVWYETRGNTKFRMTQEIVGRSFGWAIEQVKAGASVARLSWNGEFSVRASSTFGHLEKDYSGVGLSEENLAVIFSMTIEDISENDWATREQALKIAEEMVYRSDAEFTTGEKK